VSDGAHVLFDPGPDTSADRGFVRTFLATFAGLCGATILAMLWLDPLGVFGTGRAPAMIVRARDDKAAAFVQCQPAPQALILGSSQSHTLRPACVSELTGLPAFNFAVDAARSEDLLAISRFAQATAPGALKLLIIGVDPVLFFNADQRGELLAQSPHLRRYAPMRTSVLPFLGPELLGWQSLTLAVASAQRQLEPNPPPPAQSFGPDGLIHGERWDPQAGQTPKQLEQRIKRSIRIYANIYSNFTQLDAWRVEIFRELLGDAARRGIAVHAYIPAPHPKLAAAFDGKPRFLRRYRDTRGLLASLAEEGLLRYDALDEVGSFGGDPRAYFDGMHMLSSNADRLLVAMFGRAGCAVQ